jgi:hypothetical protein
MQTVKTWLESQGRKFPEPDCDDGEGTSMAAYEAANLPMVIACTNCQMTMALTAERPCNSEGEIFCADCAEDMPPEPADRSPWVICTLCRGEGHHVNPSIDAGGLSADDMNDDPDFAEGYRRGDYDVSCARCGGSGKVREAELAAIHEREHANAQRRREAAREDGDAEGYYSAGDARWG